MPIRITGMNSGLDTEALVSELVSAYRKKSEKYTKAQTKLSWKQDKWKDMNKKIRSFYNSLSSLRFSTAYNLKSATVSNSSKASVKVASSAVNGSYSVQIEKTAKSGYLTGAQLQSGTTASSKLSDLGYTGGDGKITVSFKDGKKTDIEVTQNTTISEFVDSLNKAGVKASYDSTNRRIHVASSTTGKEADFVLDGGTGDGASALTKLGLNVQSEAKAEAQRSLAAYALNEDGEAYITGYRPDGSPITNGKYDSAKTEANINDLLQKMKEAPVTITNNNAEIAYAKASKIVNNVDKGLNDADKAQLKELLFENDLENKLVDDSGEIYTKQPDGSYIKKSDNSTVAQTDLPASAVAAKTKLEDLEKAAGFTKEESGVTVIDTAKVDEYKSNMNTIAAYLGVDAPDTLKGESSAVIDSRIETLQKQVKEAEETLANNKVLKSASQASDVVNDIKGVLDIFEGTVTPEYSMGATRVDGEDAVVYVNGAKYVSSSNDITVNGVTITALEETGNEKITVSVNNNVEGLYDKIKNVLKEYNELINEMTKAYNADTAKGYEPLTAEEKESLSDSELEEWEKKIKDSLLRRDDTLDSIINTMTTSMFTNYTLNGTKYSFSSFGIHTLGALYADDYEHNALHIDGDPDNEMVSGNADKLMKALTDDPDAVVGFMQDWADSLYNKLYKKMQSTSMSSFNVVYNDKEMAKEYSDYTTTISKWEEKLQKIEDTYYKKFAAMESALAKLQAQQSNMASMLGM